MSSIEQSESPSYHLHSASDIAVIFEHRVWTQCEPYQARGLLFPAPLSLECAEVLRHHTYAAMLGGNEQDGAVLELKISEYDLHGLNALSIPTCFSFRLYSAPSAPVIRLALSLHDQPDDPLSLLAFINPNDPVDRARLRNLGTQERVLLRFFDPGLRPHFHFEANLGELPQLGQLLACADLLLGQVAGGDVDFPLARNRVALWGDHPDVTGLQED